MHACNQNQATFVFCFSFFFVLFQGEEKEERSGRLTGEGLNTYLPTSLPPYLSGCISGGRGDFHSLLPVME